MEKKRTPTTYGKSDSLISMLLKTSQHKLAFDRELVADARKMSNFDGVGKIAKDKPLFMVLR